jgi:hypothetical protein
LMLDAIEDQPPNSPAGIQRPRAGMSMDQVTSEFGEPLQRLPAVGDPPITRWVYPKFTVYFEYQAVIHSVVHREGPPTAP